MTSGIPKGKRKLTDEELKANKAARAKLRESTLEYKTKRKELSQTPKFKAGASKRNKKYFSSEKGKTTNKKAQKKYASSEKGKNFIKKYKSSGKNSVSQKKYSSSEKGKIGRKKFESSEKGYASTRLKVLQYYSKLHSNSDIPCCRCCGQNSHIDFLTVDHIDGRKNLPKEQKHLEGDHLISWLSRNNCPEGVVQILCHNCNSAKGMPRNNNECPMKGKPH